MPTKIGGSAKKRVKKKAMGRATLRAASLKVQAYRARLRRRGLRPIQIWVPDVQSSAFRREARRESRILRASPHEADEMAFVEAVSVWPDES